MFIYPAIIMDPLWPDNANEAIIYAAATSIGYEITHSFDENG
jgi:predicted metalloendopeptidase